MKVPKIRLTKDAKRQLIHFANGLSLVLFAAFVANPLATGRILWYHLVAGIAGSIFAGTIAFVFAMGIKEE